MLPFEQVVEQHGATVLRVCARRSSAADADDAWSETFLAALRAYPALPADANVEAWLVTIARRKAIDVIRARARRAVPVPEVPDRPTTRGPRSATSTRCTRWPPCPPSSASCVAYHHLAGLPYDDVAELLGGTPRPPGGPRPTASPPCAAPGRTREESR